MPAGQTVFNQIGSCYPNNQNPRPMPVMEQVANVIKSIALFSQEAAMINKSPSDIRRPQQFKTYCASKQVSVMRAAAGVTSFMNDFAVKNFFLDQNKCIRNVWTTWYALYAASNVDAPGKGNINMASLYNNWVFHVVNGVQPFLITQLQSQATLFNTGSNGAATVSLSWPVLLDQKQTNKNGLPVNDLQYITSSIQVTEKDLGTQIIGAIQPIYWASDLLQ